MYNFLQRVVSTTHRSNNRRNNRRRRRTNNIYPGSSLLHNLYNSNIQFNHTISNNNIENDNVPIFQTTINSNTEQNLRLDFDLEDTIENITLSELPEIINPIIESSDNSFDNNVNYIAQIVPGINDDTIYYLNFTLYYFH